nr:MAG TPA: hypothetical protein [Caudoviricetes sp.]
MILHNIEQKEKQSLCILRMAFLLNFEYNNSNRTSRTS